MHYKINGKEVFLVHWTDVDVDFTPNKASSSSLHIVRKHPNFDNALEDGSSRKNGSDPSYQLIVHTLPNSKQANQPSWYIDLYLMEK